MRGGAAGRRRQTEGFGGAPLPTSVDQRQEVNSRDSDASFASSRPSSIGLGRASEAYSDRSIKSTAIGVRAINAFLSSHSFPISLCSHPVSSLKDISETLKFVISALDFPCDAPKWDEDLAFLLKSLNCPFRLRLTKSSLGALNTHHNWPTVVDVIHWLVQLARYRQHLSSNPASFIDANSMNSYALDSYRHYIRGEDDLAEDLDSEFLGKLEGEKTSVAETIAGFEKVSGELEAKLEALKKGPSKKEALEKVKADLEKDANKFHIIIGEYTGRIREIEEVLEDKDKEIKAKQEERQRISEENKELKNSVDLRSFNARDAERKKRELQAVERDISEAEVARNAWEQKAWGLNTNIRNQFHQLQTLAMDCNQALRRLKVNIQYAVNEKGENPTEVMGVDYKSIMKPSLSSFADGINKSSMEKLEELITFEHHSSEMASKMESKKKLLVSIQLQIDELEEKMKSVKKETQELAAKCDVEAKTMAESIQMEALNLEAVEKDAAELLKASEIRLQQVRKQSEEEVEACSAQLFLLIDSISKHKEYMDSKILKMNTVVAEAATVVSDIYIKRISRGILVAKGYH